MSLLQGVWASKYNERAFLSMKKVGLNFLDLRMAVLVQRVVPAAYAFVIHTENPTNGAKDEIFAELVKGLGESIVSGMVPGSSLSFFAKKGSLDKPEVRCCSLRCLTGCWGHKNNSLDHGGGGQPHAQHSRLKACLRGIWQP